MSVALKNHKLHNSAFCYFECLITLFNLLDKPLSLASSKTKSAHRISIKLPEFDVRSPIVMAPAGPRSFIREYILVFRTFVGAIFIPESGPGPGQTSSC